jgi:hypothetical protein
MQLVDRPSLEPDLAFGDCLEPRDRVEQRGLAASRRADEDEEPALLQIEGDPLEDLDLAEPLLEVGDLEKGHLPILSPRRP